MLWLFQGELPMKLLVILFSAFFVTALLDVGRAVSQTARPSQALSAAHEQTLDECQARYAGGRYLGGRALGLWPLLEACFRGKTGMFLLQANVKCGLESPYRRFRSLRCLQKMSLLSTSQFDRPKL